jgi:hypothetical protein
VRACSFEKLQKPVNYMTAVLNSNWPVLSDVDGLMVHICIIKEWIDERVRRLQAGHNIVMAEDLWLYDMRGEDGSILGSI